MNAILLFGASVAMFWLSGNVLLPISPLLFFIGMGAAIWFVIQAGLEGLADLAYMSGKKKR